MATSKKATVTPKDTMSSEKNTDELKIKKEKQTNSQDADFSNVKFAYDEVSKSIIDQANHVLKLLDQTFGTNQTRPELNVVPEMFDQLMQDKKPEDYIPVLEDFQNHAAHSMDDLLKAKYTYEKNTHKNQNTYTKSCITAGAGLETAKADWLFAVNSYAEEKQNAELKLKEAVYAARKAHKNILNPNGDLESRINAHVDYYSEADAVATALGNYGKDMDKANTALVSDFSKLLTAFHKNWNAVAAGELKLISDNRGDSKTLWTSIQSYYKKKFGSN
jgi:hypothetical protein